METNSFTTPTQYFEYIKTKKKSITNQDLHDIYNNSLILAQKCCITGQTKGLKKLVFYLDTLEKEKLIIDIGIDTFVYREDIEHFIDKVANKRVKIIDLKSYEREIPDEVIEIINQIKDKFNEFYVLFTDYNNKVTKQVQEERIEKDPILFGAFRDYKTGTLLDRFYYIADWEDEYCDLTLDKMVAQMQEKEGIDIKNTISMPKDLSEIKKHLSQLEEKHNGFKINKLINTNVFKKISSFLKKK